jgi:hypothetical protein
METALLYRKSWEKSTKKGPTLLKIGPSRLSSLQQAGCRIEAPCSKLQGNFDPQGYKNVF